MRDHGGIPRVLFFLFLSSFVHFPPILFLLFSLIYSVLLSLSLPIFLHYLILALVFHPIPFHFYFCIKHPHCLFPSFQFLIHLLSRFSFPQLFHFPCFQLLPVLVLVPFPVLHSPHPTICARMLSQNYRNIHSSFYQESNKGV